MEISNIEIVNIDLFNSKLSDYQEIIDRCQKIIDENLTSNGGTLKQGNIFQKDLPFTNLLIACIDNDIIGFALLRTSENTHNLKEANNYFYLSDIVVKNGYKTRGVGTELLEKALECCGEYPLVASVLKENELSIKLLSKFMTHYGKSKTGKYYRFVDNSTYYKIYNNMEDINAVKR